MSYSVQISIKPLEAFFVTLGSINKTGLIYRSVNGVTVLL